MSIATFAHRSRQIVSDNSPAILTGAAVVGTVVTAILTGRAGFKAGYNFAMDEATGGTPENQSQMDRNKLIFKRTWKLYLPSAVTGVGTIAAIASANRISTNRTAALAAAYTITDKAFSEYKTHVVEAIGDKKETEIQDKIAQNRMENATGQGSLVILNNEDIACYDVLTDRYFPSNMEKLKKAQNDTNYELLHSMYVSLSDFYNRVGLAPTGFSDEVGWNSDTMVELHFSSVLTNEGKPALAFRFHVEPVRGYYKTHA